MSSTIDPTGLRAHWEQLGNKHHSARARAFERRAELRSRIRFYLMWGYRSRKQLKQYPLVSRPWLDESTGRG
jgi:hypothetical protein